MSGFFCVDLLSRASCGLSCDGSWASTYSNGNPYGNQPNEYISRYENTDMILSTFEADNLISQAYLI